MATRYKFSTTLEGFINVFEDGGKFNNRTFAYKLPSSVLETVEADRTELLDWAKTKATGRVQEAMTPWDDDGLCKYTYGAGDGARKPKPEPVFVDTNGDPISREILRVLRRGTKVNLIVDQKPYAVGPNVGTSMRVIGVQVIELVAGNGAVDSGDLSSDDIAGMFDKVKGFTNDQPAISSLEVADTAAALCTPEGTSYDF